MYAQRAAAQAGGLAWQIVCTIPSYSTQQKRGPCGEAMPTRGRGGGRRSHVVAEGWRGAGGTPMATPRALLTAAVPCYDVGALSCFTVFCAAQTSAKMVVL